MSDLRASIDIGSNSILLIVAEFKNNQIIKVLENHSVVTGLGRSLDENGMFLDIAMEESFEVLYQYALYCKKHGIEAEDIVATATEASRVASNAPRFYDRIFEKLGLNVQVITAEAEAYFSTIGILLDQNISEAEVTIMDIGGASTELIKVDVLKQEILTSFSMPAGAVRVNNWINAKDNNQLEQVLSDYKDELSSVKTKKLYCVAGTMTSIGNIFLGHQEFVESEVGGLVIKVSDIELIKKKYGHCTSSELLEKFVFLGKRSLTILAGLDLALAVFKRLGVETVCISTYGLRYGTLMKGRVSDEFIFKR